MPDEKDPKKVTAMLFTQSLQRQYLNDAIKAKQAVASEPNEEMLRLKTETSVVEKSFRVSISLMRVMYANLMLIDPARAEKEGLLKQVQQLEARMEGLNAGLNSLDEETISRKIMHPEIVRDKLEATHYTYEMLENLKPLQREENILDTRPESKYNIASNILAEVIGLGSSALDVLEAKANSKLQDSQHHTPKNG